MAAGLVIWQAEANKPVLIPAAPGLASSSPMGIADLAPPPEASEKTREEKRFARYDKDKNGAVGRDEYLSGRQKGFAKLDLDHDGKLSFAEYAVKGVAKFGAADRDRSGTLNANEFASTRVVRKIKPKRECPPSLRAPTAEDAPDA